MGLGLIDHDPRDIKIFENISENMLLDARREVVDEQ
jgi:hypothetical protein